MLPLIVSDSRVRLFKIWNLSLVAKEWLSATDHVAVKGTDEIQFESMHA